MVVSPSIEGLIAMINSVTPFDTIRSANEFKFKLSGPIPSIGEIKAPS